MPHVITLTGPSGCGKTTALKCFVQLSNEKFKAHVVPKYTTRPPRNDDGAEIVCVEDIPAVCDLVYEQYGVRYGIESLSLFNALSTGISPVVILNDIRTVEDIRHTLGKIARSVFIFREGPKLTKHQEMAEVRGVLSQTDFENRFRKAQAIYRIYIENIHLFDHVIINSGSVADLGFQAEQIVRGLHQEMNWPLVMADTT